MICLIAAVDEAFGMGYQGQLLCHLPVDLHYFKSLTLGKPVIMGRKTFESIGRPLPNRTNIVMSLNVDTIPGVTVVQSLDAALALTHAAPETFIIGGAAIYKASLPHADRVYLTHIHALFEADVFFPPLSETTWHCTDTRFYSRDEKNPFDLTFCCYERA